MGQLFCFACVVLATAIAPALMCRLFSVNGVFLPGIFLWRLFLPLLLVFLHKDQCFSFFSLLPSQKLKLEQHSIYSVAVNWYVLAFYIAKSLTTPGWALQAAS